MSRKRTYQWISVFMILVLIQISCAIPTFTITKNQPETAATEKVTEPAGDDRPTQPAPEPVNTSTPAEEPVSPPAPSGPPTPTPFVYQGQPPAAGKGGVYGRLLWNGKPVEGIQVKLCDEIKLLGGCKGTEYPTTTDANGVYAILNVPPGTYGLTYRALDADTWYFVTSGFLNAKDFEVPAGEMMNVGDHHTIRLDLVILTPTENQRMTIARPTLTWKPYPEAAYYELTFHSGRGGSLVHRKKLTDTSFTLDRDLQSCDYSFNIEAFNAQGVMIAENDGWQSFVIGGLPQSCKLVALTPADGATAPADKITLTWKPHEWAAVYKIHMYNPSDSKQKILDFVKTSDTQYTVTQNVPAGKYVWVVYAYDNFDDGLGFSDQFTLYVTNP